MGQFDATTIVAVKRGPDDICIGGDGQVTMGETAIMKNGAHLTMPSSLAARPRTSSPTP